MAQELHGKRSIARRKEEETSVKHLLRDHGLFLKL